MSNFFASIIVFLGIVLLLPALATLPKAVIASAMTMVIIHIIDFHELVMFYRLGLWSDVVLWNICFWAVLLLGVDIALFISLGCCMLLLVRSVAVVHPRLCVLGQLPADLLHQRNRQAFEQQYRLAQEQYLAQQQQQQMGLVAGLAFSLGGMMDTPKQNQDAKQHDLSADTVEPAATVSDRASVSASSTVSLASRKSFARASSVFAGEGDRHSAKPKSAKYMIDMSRSIAQATAAAAAVTSTSSSSSSFSSSSPSSSALSSSLRPSGIPTWVEYVDVAAHPDALAVPEMTLLRLTGALSFATIGRVQVGRIFFFVCSLLID